MLVTLQSSTLFMASSTSSLSRSALAVSAWVFVPEIIDLVACNHLMLERQRDIWRQKEAVYIKQKHNVNSEQLLWTASFISAYIKKKKKVLRQSERGDGQTLL